MPNAVSNQCGPVMMGSMDEEQTVVEVTGVEVAGKVYTLPRILSKTTEGVNFELAPNYARKLEDISIVCEEDTFANDDFSVESYIDKDGGFNLKFSMNSEVKAPALWSDGSVNFAYDAQTKAWSMTGQDYSGEWEFCKPGAVIDALVSALECFYGSKGDKGLKVIKNILIDNKAAMIASAPLFGGDCKVADPDPAVDNPLGVQVPW